jgi:transposase-like protein
MENKTRNSPTTSSNPKPKANRQDPPSYSAQQKAQAVLQVWTERCKRSEVCRELKINWTTFEQWQQRAMEGMLQALEPRANLARGAALSPRLLSLLQKRQTTAKAEKLSQRLEQIQLAKQQEETAKTP